MIDSPEDETDFRASESPLYFCKAGAAAPYEPLSCQEISFES